MSDKRPEMYDESSDDDSPESVTFAKSKENALNAIDANKTSRKRDKTAKKRLNAEREQRNIDQKKSKTLPLEILQQAEEVFKRRRKLEADDDEHHPKEEGSESESDSRSSDEDEVKFIPVVKTKKYVKSCSEAINFKSNHFFNGRIRRLNTQQHKQLRHKLDQRNR